MQSFERVNFYRTFKKWIKVMFAFNHFAVTIICILFDIFNESIVHKEGSYNQMVR